MDGWLAAAENLFRRRASLPPPPFELTCACGHVMTGERTSSFQRPTCPECRSTLFVLPVSVYPSPKSPRRKVFVPAAPQPEPDVAFEAVPDAEAGFPPKVVKTASARPAVEASASAAARGIRPPRRSVRQIVGESAVTLKLDRLRRKVFSPVKLVLAGVTVVVALTTWWIVHLRSLDEAERVVVAAARLGDEALREHDLAEAARQYKKVRKALDLLGRSDPQARVLRQTAAETSAATDLSRASLFELLHDATDAETGKTHLTWNETFNSSYRDEWVVLDAHVSRSADPAARRRYVVDFPLAEGRNRAVLVADLDVFDKAISAGGNPQRVVFAAQLDDCRRDPKHADTWLIVLRSKTGFLWSSGDNLELLGVSVDDETKQILADQSRHLGIAR
jgi:hypothetical protein